MALNSTSEELSKALKELDQVATRTQDTVLVFYVKSEQGDAHEIIENQVSKRQNLQCIIMFLLTLKHALLSCPQIKMGLINSLFYDPNRLTPASIPKRLKSFYSRLDGQLT